MLRLELGLQHERVAAVAAPGRVELALRLDRPVPVLGVAEQRREDRSRVEARQAEPVDAAVAADERGGLEIADQSVVLDAGHYSPSSRNDAKRRKRFSAARLKASRYSSAVVSSSVPAYVSLIVVEPLADRVHHQLIVAEELLGLLAARRRPRRVGGLPFLQERRLLLGEEVELTPDELVEASAPEHQRSSR